MGGINSGRRRSVNRGAVEQFPCIDLRILRRVGLLKYGECTHDTYNWQNQGLTVLSVRIFVDLSDVDNASVRVAGDVDDQRITIECVRCPYGGCRCYFLCPLTGTRCEQLFLVNGIFASRKAHKLAYAAQSEDEFARVRRKVRKLQRQIEGDTRYVRPRGCNRYAKIREFKQAKQDARELYRERLYGAVSFT